MSFDKTATEVFDCICCFGLKCAVMKIDRKGRPFVHCTACGTMVFIYNEEGLRGWRHLGGADISVLRERLGIGAPAAVGEAVIRQRVSG